MALRQALLPLPPFVAPWLAAVIPTFRSRATYGYPQHVASESRLKILGALPIGITFNMPPMLEAIWEAVLRAVPKKKTSHRKKRQRFMAGKALKDVTSLNKCSACGNVKRAHLLCPYCVQGMCDQYFIYSIGSS
jgi:ribosomal protein L32